MTTFKIRLRTPVMLALSVLAQVLAPHPMAVAQTPSRDTVPSVAYFSAIERLYRGDYRNAERTLKREVRSSIKIGVVSRWIDAIAYHTMLGEVYYQQGRLAEALVQFDEACRMYLQYSNWMIRVDFKRPPQPNTNRLRQILPWGKSKRQFTLGRFPSQELINVGSASESRQAYQQGGVAPLPQLWQLDVIEIVRATCLAIRRRNELLGPLGAHDTISTELVAALLRGTTIPNHWSKAWADLQLGLAQAGVGQIGQAEKHLRRAERIAGRFDHPLTGVVLLELGRLKMEAGDLAAAADLYAEASYSAFYYEDLGVIDEAFKLGTVNHLAGGPNGLQPMLESAANWASRKRYHHLSSQLSLALAEEFLHFGNDKGAQAALIAGKSRLKDAARGLLGNRAQYLEARLQLRQGRENATTTLAQAIDQHIGMSLHNLQLQLANQRYDQQQLRARSAVTIYQSLLGDPESADWVLRPFQTLAVLQTPHVAAFDRWLDALRTRKDMAAALEVSDLAKRHRYHRSLAWGGRLAALRDVLEVPPHQLKQQTRNQRSELLLRFPQYEQLSQAGQQLQADLSTRWQPGIDESEQRDLIKPWRAWEKNIGQREALLREIGLQRVAATLQFPPVLPTTTLQQLLQPGQAIVVFHETPASTLGFLLTSTASTSWQCSPPKRLSSLVAQFLRDLGNYDANHQVPIAELKSGDWQASGSQLFEALFQGSSLDPKSLEELIIVPDGLLWYVPFAALPISDEGDLQPLIATARLRIAPTVGLAVGNAQSWRRIQRTGIAGQAVLPGDSEEAQTTALVSLQKAVENPLRFPEPAPVSTPIIGSLVETLVVLDEIKIDLAQPFAWSPLPVNRSGKQNSLSHWLSLPQIGPQRVVLPATRTLAERGGKISKRKTSQYLPGDELFLSTCGLMSTGAQTILLSTWRVGGDATFELTREFLQELPFTTASAAWQRSTQLAMELSLDPAQQPRVKVSKKEDVELTAAHPFFWSGYLLVDTGASVENEAAAPAAKVPPVAGAVVVKP